MLSQARLTESGKTNPPFDNVGKMTLTGARPPSPRKKGDARAIGYPLHRRTVERLEPLLGEDPRDRALREPFPGAQQTGAVGRAQRVVGIMRGEQHAVPGGCERADLAHHLALVPEIEAGGRLVEHDESRLLR